jgi:hypothetical protein
LQPTAATPHSRPINSRLKNLESFMLGWENYLGGGVNRMNSPRRFWRQADSS